MKFIIKNIKLFFYVALLIVSVASKVHAFELLSEGAMDSVSASSGMYIDKDDSAPDRDEGFDQLPFETSVQIETSDTEETSVELDFALTKEVEAWATNMRDSGNVSFEVGIVEELQPSNFEVPQIFYNDGTVQVEDISAIGYDSNGHGANVTYQRGRTSRSMDLLDITHNSISVRLETYVERAATINADPTQTGHAHANTYLSDIHAVSYIRTQQR